MLCRGAVQELVKIVKVKNIRQSDIKVKKNCHYLILINGKIN
jgi:hypothetical protein